MFLVVPLFFCSVYDVTTAILDSPVQSLQVRSAQKAWAGLMMTVWLDSVSRLLPLYLSLYLSLSQEDSET